MKTEEGWIMFEAPKQSEWEAVLLGGDDGIRFRPAQGQEPNWFHRKMQQLVFGVKWRKVGT
jgi:hypothetical protein